MLLLVASLLVTSCSTVLKPHAGEYFTDSQAKALAEAAATGDTRRLASLMLTSPFEQTGDAGRFPRNRFVHLDNGKILQLTAGDGQTCAAFGKFHPTHPRSVERGAFRFEEGNGSLASRNSRTSVQADQKFSVEQHASATAAGPRRNGFNHLGDIHTHSKFAGTHLGRQISSGPFGCRQTSQARLERSVFTNGAGGCLGIGQRAHALKLCDGWTHWQEHATPFKASPLPQAMPIRAIRG